VPQKGERRRKRLGEEGKESEKGRDRVEERGER